MIDFEPEPAVVDLRDRVRAFVRDVVIPAEPRGRVVDRAVQICGSLGGSEDLPLARLLAEVRPFRIYDGPTETHHWAIARRALRNRGR